MSFTEPGWLHVVTRPSWHEFWAWVTWDVPQHVPLQKKSILGVFSFSDYWLSTALPILCTPADLHPCVESFLSCTRTLMFCFLLEVSISQSPLHWLLCGSVDFGWDSLMSLITFHPALQLFFCVLIPVNTVSSSRAVPSRALHRNSVPVALSTATQVVNRCLEWRKGEL